MNVVVAASAARWVVAAIFGLVILVVGFGSIRGLVGHGAGGPSEPPPPIDPRTRVLYWCENCGAEILVMSQGNGHGFRHCGEAMTKREEVLREG